MGRNAWGLVAAIALVAPLATASADESLLPIAIQGDWMAVAHRSSEIAPPDVCAATTPVGKGGFVFWTDGTSLEARVLNPSWSLPAGVQGNIDISVKGDDVSLPVSANESTMLSAEIDLDAFHKLVAAMDKAASMTVTVGKAAPVTVSLSGSTVAIRAFETCAGIPASTTAPAGANPFK